MWFAPPSDPVLDFAIRQWRREPSVQIEDAYKWLFQAILGGEHAIRDQREVRAWLDGEWKTLGRPRRKEPKTVPLTPDGGLVRLNLRPFKSAGGTKNQVVLMFVNSAKTFRVDRRLFVREWHNLGLRLHDAPIAHLTYEAWLKLDVETANKGYPAIDHSLAYEKANAPAYRVVLTKLLK